MPKDGPAWHAAHPGYSAMHQRLKRKRGPARLRWCFFHAERNEEVRASDWAQLPGTDGSHMADYIPLCRLCHVRLDGTHHPAGQGEVHHNHKLTAADVQVIRVLLKAGQLQAEIAQRFGVGFKAISKIKNGVTWSWLK